MVSSEPGLLTLPALRLRGFAEAENVARAAGLPSEVVEERLTMAAEDGFATYRGGARSGWSLTTEGRKENERLLAEELDGANRRSDVADAYRRFRELNPEMLVVCTDWQVLDGDAGLLNDHTDPDHDRAVVARLVDIDRSVQPICALLGGWFERFAGYGERFRAALDRVRRGELDWFTRPTIDSYHTVWFELHEDLLATLGVDRASERTHPTASAPAGSPKKRD